MMPYHASGAVDSSARIGGQTARIRAELRADGPQAVATVLVRYGHASVDHVVNALQRAGYAREGYDVFKRRLHGLAALTREAQRFEDLADGASLESWPARKAERVEVIRHGRPYSPVVSGLARRIVCAPWTPLTVAASMKPRHGPIWVVWTTVSDDEHAEWFQIGLQLRSSHLKEARVVLETLTREGFRDGLGGVVGKLDGLWAMPERTFRDLATWRSALRRVRELAG